MKLYIITFEEFPQYLYVYIQGKYLNYETSKAAWMEILDKANELKYNKILIYEDVKGNLNIDDVYKLIMDIATLLRNKKIAGVDKELDQSSINEIGLYIAKNAKLDVAVFETIESAQKWLLE